ncbi:hypothetical protein ACFXHA_26880 [Nocardia sp. NPDC059240]|uniref:hypothetical protein n=1 Tax=Nocardia sp. NPDC059240 TaxID=3346786 RepID=UPI00368FE3D3
MTATPASAAVVQVVGANVSKGYDIGYRDGAFMVTVRVDNADPVSFTDNGIAMGNSPMTPSASYCSAAGELCADGMSDASQGIHHVVITQDARQFTATYLIPQPIPGSGLYPTPIALPTGSSGS